MFVSMKIFRVHNNQSDMGGTRRGCNIHIGRPWARNDGWMNGCMDRWMLILPIRFMPYGSAEDAPIEPSPLCAPPPSRQGRVPSPYARGGILEACPLEHPTAFWFQVQQTSSSESAPSTRGFHHTGGLAASTPVVALSTCHLCSCDLCCDLIFLLPFLQLDHQSNLLLVWIPEFQQVTEILVTDRCGEQRHSDPL